MTSDEYRTALTTLGLTQQAAGRWLRVSPKTAQNYAKHGPSGPAAVAVEGEIEKRELLAMVERLGEMADVCVYPMLGRACSYCRCDRAALKGEAG